jgi:signal transduction histidine kinase
MLILDKVEQIKLKLGVCIILLLMVFYIVLYAHKRNNESSQMVTHSAQVMLKIEEITSSIYELESMQRGYLITRNQQFRESYHEIREMLQNYIGMLKKAVVNDPVQKQNTIQLEQLINDRLNVMKSNIENSEVNKGTLLEGRLLMMKVRLKLEEMKQVEALDMINKTELFKSWEGKSTVAMVVALNIIIVLILIASFVIIGEYRRRAAIENQLIENQQQLKDKVEKLDSSNRELEQFAHVASHDLQEPLRKIITFSDRITEKIAEELNPDLRNYLSRISSAATRMHVLIEDLLAYSRVSKGSTDKVKIDLEQVMMLVKENYELTIASRGVSIIQHQKLPKVLGDRTQMLLLFQNLIDNAIKFTFPETAPVIQIYVSLVGKSSLLNEVIEPAYDRYYRITIKDNGIGFDKKYLDKIFVAFQRLHGRSEFKGSGIGLSVCKRIVENHQGYIHAESEPGKGSEFHVYLPETAT